MCLCWNCKQPQDSAELFRWAPRASPHRMPPLAATATQLLLTLSPPAGSEQTTGAVRAQRGKRRHVNLQEQTECCLQTLLQRRWHTDRAMAQRCVRLPPRQSHGSDKCQGSCLILVPALTLRGHVQRDRGWELSWYKPSSSPQAVSLAIRLRGPQGSHRPGGPSQLCSIQTGGEGWIWLCPSLNC